MTYRWLSDLDQALTRAGVPFVEVGRNSLDPTGAADWRTRGRPTSTGQFDTSGVLCHHTASPAGTSDQAELNVILRGNSEAPGPISQLLIGRSTTVYLVAAGRANHAGTGSAPWFNGGACGDMNARLIGIEVANNGVGERWSDALCAVYGRVTAALCGWYGWSTDRVLLHATITRPCPVGNKIDPAGPWTNQPTLTSQTWDLDTWRAFVSTFTDESPVPPQPSPPEDDMAWIGPYLIQATGADGTANGAVYSTDGFMQTVRWLSDPAALAGYRWTMRNYGVSAPELEDNGPILAVDTIAAYGVVIGAVPPAG